MRDTRNRSPSGINVADGSGQTPPLSHSFDHSANCSGSGYVSTTPPPRPIPGSPGVGQRGRPCGAGTRRGLVWGKGPAGGGGKVLGPGVWTGLGGLPLVLGLLCRCRSLSLVFFFFFFF